MFYPRDIVAAICKERKDKLDKYKEHDQFYCTSYISLPNLLYFCKLYAAMALEFLTNHDSATNIPQLGIGLILHIRTDQWIIILDGEFVKVTCDSSTVHGKLITIHFLINEKNWSLICYTFYSGQINDISTVQNLS